MQIRYAKSFSLGLVTLLALNPTFSFAMGRGHQTQSTTVTPISKVKAITDASAPLVLVYRGPGSCSVEEGDAGSTGYGCSQAAADVAATAGFRVRYIGPQDLTASSTSADVDGIFKDAKAWMQPGGVAGTAAKAMSDRLKSELVKFVSGGGGYFGICAGAFLATSQLGTTSINGLGIFPGHTKIYKYTALKHSYALLNVNWLGTKRVIYFEGGPYLYDFGSSAEVVGTFSDGYVASARANYGRGRVFVTGPHVEAPSDWTSEDNIKDPDGADYEQGAQMLKWVSGLSAQ